MKIEIYKGIIKEAFEISKKIPEFDKISTEKEYEKRLSNTKYLILIAKVNNELVGFKVGYDRYNDGSFYSWIGGVIPEYRKKGIAKKLAEEQELWAKKQGYKNIKIKTRNKFRNMLIFLITSGFKIIDIEKKEQINENRIILKKDLK
jgi:ribosomal protein S18 acetylase RimI-like enzyme